VRSTFTGRCVAVADGDTLSVMRDGREQRVRLWGVDSPEKRQDYGSRAKQFVSDIAFGRALTVQETGRDRYGRSLGWVLLSDGRSLNVELVRAGMAWWYRSYAPRAPVLERMEAEARRGRAGLWGMRSPEPPWEFRRERRSPGSARSPRASR
jgi:endonuclease YncB( thermonuclease family)